MMPYMKTIHIWRVFLKEKRKENLICSVSVTQKYICETKYDEKIKFEKQK